MSKRMLPSSPVVAQASTSALTLASSSGSRYISKIVQDVEAIAFLALWDLKVSLHQLLEKFRGCCSLRPYCAKVRGRDGSVVKSVHLKEHRLPLAEEATAPEWVISISSDG